jgi:hypothetical protein
MLTKTDMGHWLLVIARSLYHVRLITPNKIRFVVGA